jgi:GNAT superfamily N-acetyltransferase
MPASPVFRTEPRIAAKTLLAFRQDAGWDNTDMAALEGGLQPGSRVAWAMVRLNQKLIGIARLELAPPRFCHVSDFIVLRTHRGRGTGAWMMAAIERHCTACGIPRVLLQPNPDSLAFYEKLRFVADPLVPGFMKKEIGPVRRTLLPF